MAQQKLSADKVTAAYAAFSKDFEPVEHFGADEIARTNNTLLIFKDQRTGANYCDCHIRASKLGRGLISPQPDSDGCEFDEG